MERNEQINPFGQIKIKFMSLYKEIPILFHLSYNLKARKMGSNQGIIWNDSDFPIQYIIYGAYQEQGETKTKTSFSPKLDVNLPQGGLVFEGFQTLQEGSVSHKYAQACVEVQPGRHSQTGLSELKPNKHKISIRIKVGEFVKYLIKDVVIKSETDICLKIRHDLSLKNLSKAEVESLVEEDESRSQIRKQREERRKKNYEQTLNQLKSIKTQLSN